MSWSEAFALVGAIVGFTFFFGLPEFIDAWEAQQKRKHEREMARMQRTQGEAQ